VIQLELFAPEIPPSPADLGWRCVFHSFEKQPFERWEHESGAKFALRREGRQLEASVNGGEWREVSCFGEAMDAAY
jgi:hypothetical protein